MTQPIVERSQIIEAKCGKWFAEFNPGTWRQILPKEDSARWRFSGRVYPRPPRGGAFIVPKPIEIEQ